MKAFRLFGALLLVAGVVACGRGGGVAGDNHAHDENLQITAYNDQFEVFAEVTPLVVGRGSDILAHFTLLSDFKPLSEGAVTVSLIVDSDGIRQSVEQPIEAGIYSFSLTPAVAGVGRLVFEITRPSGVSQVVARDVRVYDDAHEADHAAAEAAVTSTNGVVFTKEQSWKVDFATEQARAESFGGVIRSIAQVEPTQGDERVIAAKSSGIVSFSNDNVVEGRPVVAGQALFTIESGGMADNNLSVKYNEAMAEYIRAKGEYERKSELAKDKIVSQSDLMQAQRDYTSAEANYENMRKNFSSGRQVVSSPIGGFIKSLMVRNGEFVEAGQAIATVSQNRELMIKAELQPKYYPQLSTITTANIRLLNSDQTYSLDELGGRVVSFGRAVDVNNPLVPVLFKVRNSVGLLPGSFVELYIKTQTSATATTIPNEAIIEQMGSYFVFVQLTPEFFEKREVTKGATDGFRSEIVSGLSAGERVVGRGAILVKLAQASGTLDAHSGHAH